DVALMISGAWNRVISARAGKAAAMPSSARVRRRTFLMLDRPIAGLPDTGSPEGGGNPPPSGAAVYRQAFPGATPSLRPDHAPSPAGSGNAAARASLFRASPADPETRGGRKRP